jgi:nitroimidazol reductase NimA-like FMN-containing flavoprotein (pyridoxamine 5'-phosphate oxidase superfamily)
VLVRLALAGPRAALELAEAARRSAVSNAFKATVAVTGAVAERRHLAPTEDDASPGSLSRLGKPECLELLRTHTVGRLAYVAREDVPDVVPVNYVVHEGAILLRSGVGPKLQAAERRAVVAFEVDEVDEHAHTGWSVVAVGKARRLSPAERDALPADAVPVAWARGPRWAVIRIDPTRIEGRRLT